MCGGLAIQGLVCQIRRIWIRDVIPIRLLALNITAVKSFLFGRGLENTSWSSSKDMEGKEGTCDEG